MKLYTLLGVALALTSITIFSSDNGNEGYFEIKIPALEHIENTKKSLNFATRNLMAMGMNLNKTLEQLPANIATMVDQRFETASKEIKKELSTRPKQIGIIAASLPPIYYGVPLFVKGIKSAFPKNKEGEVSFNPGWYTLCYLLTGAILSGGGLLGIITSDTIAEYKLSDNSLKK